jgi:hypothetical protein
LYVRLLTLKKNRLEKKILRSYQGFLEKYLIFLEDVFPFFLQQGLSLEANILEPSDINYDRISRNVADERNNKGVQTYTALYFKQVRMCLKSDRSANVPIF